MSREADIAATERWRAGFTDELRMLKQLGILDQVAKG